MKSTTLVAPPTVWSCVIDVYTERPRVCSILYTCGRNMVEPENVILEIYFIGKCFYLKIYTIVVLNRLVEVSNLSKNGGSIF